MTTAAPDALRSDAKRNRERIVAVARELFACSGPEVSARAVAAKAGIGVGTLYRHFPTREELLDAVLEDAFDETVALAERALEEPDPWAGFTQFIERTLELHIRNQALRDVVETRAQGRERADAMRKRLRPLIRALVQRAQADGSLREDFKPEDLILVYWASDRVAEMARGTAPNVWRRHLALTLDGLRARAANPLPVGPLSTAQIRRLGERGS